MSDTMKKGFHYFVLTDYEKEEEFLRKRHNEGWHLVKVHLQGIYCFEKGEPEDMVYRLDFNPQYAQDRPGYLQMFEDYGWEYLQDLNEYSYFRKPAGESSSQDEEIFSDNESRLAMLKRIYQKRMLPILAIFLLCLMPQLGQMWVKETLDGLEWILTILFSLLFVIYLWLIGRCAVGFARLKKKYGQN